MAAGNANDIFTITNTEFADNEITYTVKVSANQTKITGAIINVCFDSNLLEVVNGGAAGTYNEDGDFVPYVSGMYESGLVHNNAGIYAMAYINMTGCNVGASAKNMFTVTFRVKSESRPRVNVDFKCVEYITDDGDVYNDIKKSDGPQTFANHSFHTLEVPQVTEVNAYGDGLRVVWSASEGAESYKIYRKAANESVWTLINVNLTENEYVDNSINKGTEYYYTVAAVNSFGETAYDKTGLSGMNFGKIDSINAVLNGNSAVITWSAVAGAEKYEVYRKTSTSADWQKLKTVTSTTYTDTSLSSGVEYSYKVRAIKGSYTADISCAPATVKYLAAPVATVANINDGIEISFIAVGGAEKYVIERKSGNGAYTVIAEIDGEQECYLDENVVAGTQYTYRLQSVATDISSVKAETASIKRLGTPILKAVVIKENGLEISWNAADGATAYVVYRKAAGENDVSYENVKATKYLDTNVVSGTEYTYFVWATNTTGEGAFDGNGISGVYLAKPKMTGVDSKDGNIVVTWDAVSGAEGYNVYRAEAGKAWEKVATVNGLTYTDVNPASGVVYKYTVSAVKGVFESLYDTTGLEGMNFKGVASISAVALENGAKISWSAVPDATYELYRKEATASSWTKVATALKVTEYTDTAITSGVLYNYKVKALNGKYTAEMSCEPVSVKFLGTPSAVAKNVENGIQITVTPVNGADGYIVEKEINGNFVKIKELAANAVSFVDTDVKAGQTYKYRVYAKAGVEVSAKSGVVTAARLGTPKNTSGTNVVSGTTMSWTVIEGADSYKVLRKAPGDIEWKEIASGIKTNSYVDSDVENAVVYTYTIKAVTKTGEESGFDPVGRSITFVETPKLIQVANDVGGVLVKWNGVEGSTIYHVYRRGAGTNLWYHIGSTTDTKFTDKESTASNSIKSGNYYRYTVRATNGYLSGYDTNGLYLKYVATPKLAGISNATNGIYIRWNGVSGVTNGYRVYRRCAGSSYWKYLATVKTTYFTDTEVKNSSGYYYRYTVVADAGKHSAFDIGGLYIRRVCDPVLVSAKSYAAGITVSWKAVGGAQGYNVYRKTANSNWSFIGRSTTTSYVDKTAKKGTTYTYTVRAYYGSILSSYNTKGISCKDLY